ncbi:type II secretion system protein GspN [Sorangium sp. So ce362]|uniref:type II secretion system protein GspN n=1 Tax=Sorangium sp. So ce362 TaxID=3133303 RepID=UPI003F5DF6AC
MKERLVKIAKWAAYPLFYLFCLGLFGYLTFPYDRLKDRLIAEFDRTQQKRGSGPAQRLEIDELDSYWFTGVEMKGVRLILPPNELGSSSRSSGAAAFTSGDAAKDSAPKPSVIEIEEAHARVKILPFLIGRTRISFWASVFGGEVEGVVPMGKSDGDVHVEVSDVELAQVEPLGDILGLPIAGTLSANLDLSAPEGKFNKANGALEVSAKEVSVGDGKTKIQGLIALPEAKLGELLLSAEAKDGVLKITKMTANGRDLELDGDGKVNMREPWNNSTADLYVRFKFADAYRSKNDVTKSLLGAPGSSVPGLIEMQQPKMKRSKRADGFYGWHVHGALKRPRFDPHAADSPAARGRGKAGDAAGSGAAATARKPGGVNLPLGASEAPARDSEEEASPPPLMPPPPPPPPPPSTEDESPTGEARSRPTPPPPAGGEGAPPVE